MSNSYTVFKKIIGSKIEGKTILECGSRDCLDAISMHEIFKPSIIYSFECNPESYETCVKNARAYENIIPVNLAVSNLNGSIDFWATDMENSTDKNIGASSVLFHDGGQKEFKQKKITVPCARMDTFLHENQISNIGLLCLDLQQYELVALEGLGDKLKEIQFVISELNFSNYYKDGVLFDEINSFFEQNDFQLIACHPEIHLITRDAFADGLYLNRKFL